jgi:hypothetical protein
MGSLLPLPAVMRMRQASRSTSPRRMATNSATRTPVYSSVLISTMSLLRVDELEFQGGRVYLHLGPDATSHHSAS